MEFNRLDREEPTIIFNQSEKRKLVEALKVIDEALRITQGNGKPNKLLFSLSRGLTHLIREMAVRRILSKSSLSASSINEVRKIIGNQLIITAKQRKLKQQFDINDEILN